MVTDCDQKMHQYNRCALKRGLFLNLVLALAQARKHAFSLKLCLNEVSLHNMQVQKDNDAKMAIRMQGITR